MNTHRRNNFLLDADETILDFPRSSRESFAYAMRFFGLEELSAEFSRFRAINDALWREFERGTMPKNRLVVERFRRFLEGSAGARPDAAEVNRVYFNKLCSAGYLLPGADGFLHELRRRGKVFLITNGTPQAQYGRLDALGIRALFDGIFVSDEIGFAKPDPRFFGYVFAHTGADAADSLVIGDSLTSDIAGANAVGIPCIWYAPEEKDAVGAVPSAVARSYTEVLKIIDEGLL